MTDAMFHLLIKDSPWPTNAGTRTAIGPLPGAASTAAIAELATRADIKRPIVVLVASSTEAHTLERELPLFLANPAPILTLPDWETLPYDHFSPHQDIVSQRLRTFYELPNLATHHHLHQLEHSKIVLDLKVSDSWIQLHFQLH